MIKFITGSADDNLIEFSPKDKRRSNKTITRNLAYGHYCDWCNNIIQAMFLTDKKIDLSLYEETRVISQGDKNEGNLLKVVPNKEDTTSAYKIDFYQTKAGNAQLIRLKNHLINWHADKDGSNKSEDYFEVGERCCKYTGAYSLREEDIINEASIIANFKSVYYYMSKEYADNSSCNTKIPWNKVPVSYLSEYVPDYSWNKLDYKIIKCIGTGRPLLLIPRDYVRYGNNNLAYVYKLWNTKLIEEAKETNV